MKTKKTSTTLIQFNEQTLNSFDLLMDKGLGYKYEGTFSNNLWIYRKSTNEQIDIQVGNGGVQYVSIYKRTGGTYDRTSINITGLKNVAELYKEIRKTLAVSK